VAGGCIFCAIVQGDAPAHRVHEDDLTVAIMDIHPAAEGHVLVIPKRHSETLWDIPIKDAVDVMEASVTVARMVHAALSPDGVNLFHATGRAAWQTIFHFHVHVIPRSEGDTLTPPWSPNQPRADDSSLRKVAARIRSGGPPSGQRLS
jgi:histidine triad (HIT) family protein